MYKLPYRVLLRQSLPRSSSNYATPRISRRLLSATPAAKSRSWKSSAARWALAIGGVYYYNTSDVFAEAPKLVSAKATVVPGDISDLPTIESISEGRKAALSTSQGGKEEQSVTTDAAKSSAQEIEEGVDSGGDVEGLEEEAGREGAFNPETGEINWDCPCLGGMAHGPCGPEFRAAFSCFVYSQEEPKGMDCIEKFKGMQDCFRHHPDVYGEELDEEEKEQRENNAEVVQADEDSNSSPALPSATSAPLRSNSSSQGNTPEKVADSHSLPATSGSLEEVSSKNRSARAAREDAKGIEEGSLVPKDGYSAKKDSDDK